jgi:Transglycosylase SLT domain
MGPRGPGSAVGFRIGTLGFSGDHNTSLSEPEWGSWEPRHYGFTLNAGATSLGYGVADGEGATDVQDVVPARFAPAISRAGQRWSVSAALLARSWYVESRFNPLACSAAGARGIAQFIPGTAVACGLGDPVRRRAYHRRPCALDARSAALLLLGPARAGRPTTPARGAFVPAAASPRSARPGRASPTSSDCSTARATPTAPAQARSRSGSCAEPIARTRARAVGDDGRGGWPPSAGARAHPS